MVTKVKIIGLQRSGTTYIEFLLERNFNVNTYKKSDISICWKHAFPQEDYMKTPSGSRYLGNPISKILSENDIMVVVVRKKFESWVESINRYPADLFIKRPLLKNASTKVLKATHDDFYTKWIKDLEDANIKYYLLEYEDILRNFSGILSDIKEFGLEQITNSFENIEKIPQSRVFTEDMKNKYLNK